MSSSVCEPNPDVAGPGVIGAFIATAILTLALSWWQIICAKIIMEDKYAAKSSVDVGINSPRLQKALPAAINGFGAAQLVTALALLAGTIRQYGSNKTDKHTICATALVLLAIASHLPPTMATIRTRTMPYWTIGIRLALGISELGVLIWFLWSGEQSSTTPVSTMTVVMKIATGALVVIAIFAVIVGLMATADRHLTVAAHGADWGTRGIALLSSLITVALCGIILYLKVNTQVCDLKVQEDSEMSFGQFFTILMLASPVLSFVESLFLTEEEKEEQKPGDVELQGRYRQLAESQRR